MFLAAAQYFKSRMADSQWLQDHFLSGVTTTSAATNLAGIMILTKLHRNAVYPKRIISSLALSTVVFCLLTLSTVIFLDIHGATYYAFLLTTVFLSTIGTALIQNGLFAYVTGFGLVKYTQGIMTGQGVAGVLPAVVQIVTVLSVSAPETTVRSDSHGLNKSAFLYFLTAAGITSISLVAFLYLVYRRGRQRSAIVPPSAAADDGERQSLTGKDVSLLTIAWKLKWFATSLFLTFSVTMVYPPFTQMILSVRPLHTAGRLFQPDCFVPFAFFVWNLGDLTGKMLPLHSFLRVDRWPRVLFTATLARLAFIPLYMLCNIKGNGAVVNSDFFYLVVVQLLFGITNGLFSTVCFMAAPGHVDRPEQEAAGSFMSLCLVAGLTVGSLLSFTVS